MDEDYLAMRLLDIIGEAAKDYGWIGAWKLLLLSCNVDGCLALAAWIERQSPEWRAETCLAMTGHELYPTDAPS